MKEKKIYSWMCVLNILLPIFTHFMTMRAQLSVFIPRETATDDVLHYYIFSGYRNNIVVFSEIFTAYIFDFTIILVIVSIFLRNYKKYVNSYRFLMASVWIKIVAYATCVFTNMVLGNCRIEGGLWLYIIGLVLLIIAGFTMLFGTTEEMKKRNKKWDVFIALLCTVVFFCLIVMPTLFFVKDDSKKVKEIRSLLANHPDTVVEEVGYQIGNYSNGISVYAEGKLYFVGYGQRWIYSVDKDGSYKEFYKTDHLYKGLYYDNGYLYALELKDDSKCCIIRISLNSKEKEVLYEGNNIFDFGVADSKLYFGVYSADGADSIYYIDLTEDNPGENIILYDTGVWRDMLNHNVFAAKYIHNNTSTAVEWSAELGYRDNTVIYNDSIYRVDYFKTSQDRVNKPSNLECQTFNNQGREEIVIDDNVVCFNLFNETLYYVKEFDGTHYEVWSCDLQGNNKTLIGEMNVNSGGCGSISVGEGFVYICFAKDYDAEPYIPSQGYVINISDGCVQQIY